MLAVEDAPAASAWYQRALGASVLWSLGGVVGLELASGMATTVPSGRGSSLGQGTQVPAT